MTNDGPPLPTDEATATDHARQNMQVLSCTRPFPDQPIGPGLDQVLYVQSEEYSWEAAVMAVFTEAGVPVPDRPPRIGSPPDRDRLPVPGPNGRVRSEET
ncbi:hypothetical protein GCM10010433_75160 [Streptomyces pulveraceus]|uniref:Uncharacterized protein n=1 Tax=Streptomyces pulveraceus TaxID=68258 RepID=A0ABW1GKN0_9ACTN